MSVPPDPWQTILGGSFPFYFLQFIYQPLYASQSPLYASQSPFRVLTTAILHQGLPQFCPSTSWYIHQSSKVIPGFNFFFCLLVDWQDCWLIMSLLSVFLSSLKVSEMLSLTSLISTQLFSFIHTISCL